jgi:hypothetical protein
MVPEVKQIFGKNHVKLGRGDFGIVPRAALD